MCAFRVLPLVLMLVLAVAGWLWGDEWSARYAACPWVVSLVCVGLPHGAADLAVARRRMTGRQLAVAASGYVAVLGVSLLAFVAAPAIVLPAFMVLSAWHFGLPLGGFAVGVPLIAWPDATADVAREVADVVVGQPQFTSTDVRGLGLTIVAVSLVVLIRNVTRAARHGGWRAAVANVLDASVITLLGLTTDPLFSVGVFFLCWHAWREMPHVASDISGSTAIREARGSVQARGAFGPSLRGPPRRDLYRPRSRRPAYDARELVLQLVTVHLAALPLLVPTWLALAAAWGLLPGSRLEHSLRGLAILSLAAYVVVTPPHVAAVSLGGRMMRLGRADALHGRPSLAGSESVCIAMTRSTSPLRPPVAAPSVGFMTGCSPGPTHGTD
ncbi:MAG: Brp/Blh family beta-carotene 15,15'-dioxygenase [Pirellulales bacterium]